MRILVLGGIFWLALSFGCATSRSNARSDLDRLQGRWALVSAEKDGTPVSASELQRTRITFAGNRFTFSDGSTIGTSASGTITLNPQTSPRAMDATSTTGEVFPGIYEIIGDTYRVSFATPGKPRPRFFAASKGSGLNVQVWRKTDQ